MKRSERLVFHSKEKLELINPTNLEILNRFKVDMVMRNLSAQTQEHYILDIQAWFIYILEHQNNKDIKDISDDNITEFLYYCISAGNNTARIKIRIAVISSLYKFMRKKHLIVENPVEFIDRPKKGLAVIPQNYLTSEQVAKMREELIKLDNIEIRLYATLSLSTMARVSAIASIKWEQIDLENKIVKDVLEKESKIVNLYFSNEVKCLLLALKQDRLNKNIDDSGWLFYSKRKKGEHIATGTLNSWCKVIGKLIGVPSLHPHDFRHSGATLLKNAGMSLEDISMLLSHESTQTTKKHYIKEDGSRVHDIKDRYNI